MIEQKKVFYILVLFSMGIHLIFYFISTKIFINAGYKFEREVKSAFRVKNISIIPVSYIRRIRHRERKIRFLDLKAHILNERKKLLFDNSIFKEENIRKDFSFGVNNELLEKERFKIENNKIKSSDLYFEKIIKSKNSDKVGETKKRIVEDKPKSYAHFSNKIGKNKFKKVFENQNYSLGGFIKKVAEKENRPESFSNFIKENNKVKIDKNEKKDISYFKKSLLNEKIRKEERATDYLNLDKYIKIKTEASFSEAENIGYFKTTLSVRSAKNELGSFPKDIVFVLDISRSMDEEQVNKIIKGVKKIVLTKLDVNDRFNIVLFSKKNKFFSKNLASTKKYGLKRALDIFFGNVVLRGQTDVYASLSDIITRWPADKKRAAIIVLISDGYSTSGIKNPQELIRKITELNNGNWRIYCFGNYRADKYLLDMLSYMNRGYSVYEKNFIRIERGLMKLFMEIKDPVLLNVKFQYTGLGIEKLYPIVIPDLFEKGNISLYGVFSKRDSIFSGRIVGDTLKGKGEVIVYEDLGKMRQTNNFEELKKEFYREMSFELKKP